MSNTSLLNSKQAHNNWNSPTSCITIQSTLHGQSTHILPVNCNTIRASRNQFSDQNITLNHPISLLPHNPEHTKPPTFPLPIRSITIHVRVSVICQCDFTFSQWIKITLHQVDMYQPVWIQTYINMCHQYLPESAIQPQWHDTHLSDIVHEISNAFLPGFQTIVAARPSLENPLPQIMDREQNTVQCSKHFIVLYRNGKTSITSNVKLLHLYIKTTPMTINK